MHSKIKAFDPFTYCIVKKLKVWLKVRKICPVKVPFFPRTLNQSPFLQLICLICINPTTSHILSHIPSVRCLTICHCAAMVICVWLGPPQLTVSNSLNLLSVLLFVRPAKSPLGPKGTLVALERCSSPQELGRNPPQGGWISLYLYLSLAMVICVWLGPPQLTALHISEGQVHVSPPRWQRPIISPHRQHPKAS